MYHKYTRMSVCNIKYQQMIYNYSVVLCLELHQITIIFLKLDGVSC